MNFPPMTKWLRNRDFFHDEFIDTRIPAALSNDENKLLEENVEARMKEIASKQSDIEENVDRIRLLEEHYKMVQDELHTIQRLLAARRAEDTTERSHVDIDIAEIQRLKKQIANLDTQLTQIITRKTSFQSETDQLRTEIAQIESETSAEKERLETVIEMMKKRDEEAFCFIKYTREDDLRIKELTAELERLSEESMKLKRATEEERLDYASLEGELDKIASTFRRSHRQRQQLIRQWETILTQMQRKDGDIDRLAVESIQIKVQSRTAERQLNEQKIFYEREQKNNTVTENLSDLAKQNVKALKAKQKTSNEKRESLETDALASKTVLLNTQNQLQRERAALAELTASIAPREQQLMKLKERHEQILDRKRSTLNEKLTIQEKLSKLEKSMENEQTYQNNLNQQYKKFSENAFALNNELSFLRKRERQFDIDNQTYRSQIHNIKGQINRLDQQLFKQQELIYHQDFLKQTVDRRLSRMSGEKSTEKSSESELKIRQLQSEFEKQKSQHDQLANQMKTLYEELRVIKREFAQLNEEKQGLNEKFLQFDLHMNLSEKMIKKLNNEKEDYLVESNLLHVELKRLKDILHHSSEKNCTLEQQQIEIQKAVKERRLEVQANAQLFRMRLNDERSKKMAISTELAMRITKIVKLKQRYESFAVLLNTDKSDNEQIYAQAHHVIQCAQMKEELFQQGDQLESLIIKAETELRALENTVQILNWKNLDVKKTFEKLNESSSERCDMNELAEHLRAVTEQVKIRRKHLKALTTNEHTVSHMELINEIERLDSVVANKHQLQAKLEEEIEQYHVKTSRADQLIKRCRATMKTESGVDEIEHTELDIDVRLQRDTTKKIEQQLISLCSSIGDDHLINTFECLAEEQGCRITVRPKSTPQGCAKKYSTPSSSNMSITHISIDGISRSSQSSAKST